MNRDYTIFLIILMLTAVTFLTMPRIDHAKGDVLFYAKSLSLLYFVSVIGSFVFAIICKREFLSLFSTILFGFLIIYTPLVLFVQLWFPDIYFYLSESLALANEGHFGAVGHSAESPGVSLMSGSYLLITNVDSIVFAKIYQGMLITTAALLLYSIAKRFNVSNPSFAPLIFFSIVWQDELHFCRLSYSLIFYLAFLLLCIRKPMRTNRNSSRGNILASLVLIPALVLSHPATPMFLLLNLITAMLLLRIFIGPIRYYLTEIFGKTILLAVTWVSWHMTREEGGALSTLTTFGQTVVQSLRGGPQLQSAEMKLSGFTYTTEYYFVIRLHLIHWMIIFSLALSVFLVYHFRHNITGLLLAACLLSSQSTAVIFYYGGLAFFSRPSLFTYIVFAPIAAITFRFFLHARRDAHPQAHLARKTFAILGLFLILFVSFSAFSIPVLKYSDTPFLYLPTSEHTALKFAIKNLPTNMSLVSTSYNTPGGFYSLMINASGGQRGDITYHDWRFVVGTEEIDRAAVLVLESCSTRDAFFETNPTYDSLLTKLTSYLRANHSKVYDANGNVSLFMPIRP